MCVVSRLRKTGSARTEPYHPQLKATYEMAESPNQKLRLVQKTAAKDENSAACYPKPHPLHSKTLKFIP